MEQSVRRALCGKAEGHPEWISLLRSRPWAEAIIVGEVDTDGTRPGVLEILEMRIIRRDHYPVVSIFLLDLSPTRGEWGGVEPRLTSGNAAARRVGAGADLDRVRVARLHVEGEGRDEAGAGQVVERGIRPGTAARVEAGEGEGAAAAVGEPGRAEPGPPREEELQRAVRVGPGRRHVEPEEGGGDVAGREHGVVPRPVRLVRPVGGDLRDVVRRFELPFLEVCWTFLVSPPPSVVSERTSGEIISYGAAFTATTRARERRM